MAWKKLKSRVTASAALAVAIFAVGSIGFSQDGVFVGFECGLFSKCLPKVMMSGPVDGIFSADGEGSKTHVFVISGQPAVSLSRAAADRAVAERIRAEQAAAREGLRISPPPQGPIIQIRDQRGHLQGGVYSIPESQGLLVAARHLFQSQDADASVENLSRGFAVSRLNPADYQLMTLVSSGKDLDLVIFIPRNLQPPQQEVISGAWLKRFLPGEAEIEIGDRWASWQMGSIGQSEVDEQYSFGSISRTSLSLSRFWLDLTLKNHSSPGSSGSVIWISPQAARYDFSWSLGGFAECVVTQTKTPEGLPSNPAVRVIPLTLVLQSQMVPTSLEQLAGEKKVSEDECTPIDRRGGGGW